MADPERDRRGRTCRSSAAVPRRHERRRFVAAWSRLDQLSSASGFASPHPEARAGRLDVGPRLGWSEEAGLRRLAWHAPDLAGFDLVSAFDPVGVLTRHALATKITLNLPTRHGSRRRHEHADRDCGSIRPLPIIDVVSHFTETSDIWTTRAPRRLARATLRGGQAQSPVPECGTGVWSSAAGVVERARDLLAAIGGEVRFGRVPERA